MIIKYVCKNIVSGDFFMHVKMNQICTWKQSVNKLHFYKTEKNSFSMYIYSNMEMFKLYIIDEDQRS